MDNVVDMPLPMKATQLEFTLKSDAVYDITVSGDLQSNIDDMTRSLAGDQEWIWRVDHEGKRVVVVRSDELVGIAMFDLDETE